MRWPNLARSALLSVAICCIGMPEAEAIEDFTPPGLAADMDDGRVNQVRRGGGMRRGGGGMHRGGGFRGGGMHRGGFNRGGCAMHRGGRGGRPGGAYAGHRPVGGARYPNRGVNRNVNRNVNRAAYGYRGGYYGSWARPGRYWWPAGGAIAAGAALGWVSSAAYSWAGAAPGPNLCWYYTDASRQQGFWDACP